MRSTVNHFDEAKARRPKHAAEPDITPREQDDRSFSDGRILLVAFKGWNDAGDAATEAARHVQERLIESSERVWVCDDERFFDYSLHRPIVRFAEGGERELAWPSVTMTGPRDLESARAASIAVDAEMSVSGENSNIFVLTGIEPTLNWKSFVECLFEAIDYFEIDRIILTGALLADTPHTRPTTVYASSEHPGVREELGVSRSDYEGPTGMLGLISSAAYAVGIPCVSYWAAVPHYVNTTPSPKATTALLDKLEEVLDLTISRGELVEEAQRWQEAVNVIASQDDDLREYIRVLEHTYDTVEAPEASGEAIAREFERYLEQSANTTKSTGSASHPSARLDAGSVVSAREDTADEPGDEGDSQDTDPSSNPDGEPESDDERG